MTAPAPSPNGNILICPLGDSFTAGLSSDTANGNNGYRAHLWDMLVGPNETRSIQYVGSQVSGTANYHHEGHSGYTIAQVSAGVQGGWLTNPAPALAGPPQVVILTCGSNDFGANHTAGQVLTDMSALLDLLLALPSTPVVVLTEQILQSGSISHQLTDNSRRQQPYTADLSAMVAGKPPGRVLIARCGDIRQQNLDSSGVHLSDLGYQQMEYRIYRALGPVFGWPDGAGRSWMVNRPCPYDSIPEA